MSCSEDAQNSELKIENESDEDFTKNEDEQLIEGMVFSGVSNNADLADPAILAVREIPKFRYSREELVSLRDLPLSKKKPDFINLDTVPPNIFWNPELWTEVKKSTTPVDTNARTDQQQPDNRRRPGDPRERIRKENDGIVLSPQRRSFNSGCFVPMREQPPGRPTGARPHSPMGGAGKGDNSHINIREIQTGGSRRIGSGRILRDSWDFNEKNEGGDNDYYRGGQEERRSFRRDFDITRENQERRNSGGRFGGNRRITGGDKDEEPEWFSGGPMSQNDTIELRGFDEPEKARHCSSSRKKSQAKRVREWIKKKFGPGDEKLEEEKEDTSNQVDSKSGGTETPNPQDDVTEKGTVIAPCDKDEQQGDNNKENRQMYNNMPSSAGMEVINENSFNFDDIFKCDSIPDLLTNSVEGNSANNSKSRFSRWFKQESPEKTSESRRSSLQEEHILKNLLNDINEPATVAIPPHLGNSESYFAPISPAAVNAGGGEPDNPRPGQVNIAEMFQRGKREQVQGNKAGPQGDPLNNIKTQFPGKVMSLNELESRMRRGADISGNNSQTKVQAKPEDEMAAFRRLLAQVSGGHVVTANNGTTHQKMPPMSLMEMLSHSQQQEEVQARLNQKAHMLGAPGSPKPPAMGPLHNEFLLKMQQAQQEQQAQMQRQQQVNMLNKLMGIHSTAPHLRASPLQDLAQQQSKELLSRPEAQAILQGLKRGDITPQHLYQQLANPALQPRHREMLCAILKLHRMGPSPRVLSPVPPPHHMFNQQQQQLRVSPLPNAMHQRIPSPRELQVHTQNILQRALIKKKLEEQQENFRKKQEMQQPGHSPNNSSSNKTISSPTPLAFTPTSVLRKMTADKEDGNKESKNPEANKFPQGRAVIGARIQQQSQNNQWNNQYHSKQPGRPIVKANTSYQNSGNEQFYGAHQQQSYLFNQQRHPVGQQPPVSSIQQTSGCGPYGQPPQNTGVLSLGNIGQYSNQSNHQNQQFPQLTQQQLRAQHQQQTRPVTTGNQQQQQSSNQQKSQDFSNQQNTTWQQFLNAASQQTNRNTSGRSVGASDGDLSPTSNQLARWFSSDLLERARGGELPSTAGLAQHAVSLEEVERQAAPPVRN